MKSRPRWPIWPRAAAKNSRCNIPAAGRFSKRPVGYYAGALIEQAGLKGYRVGDAQVSEMHAGFVINRGHATSSEIYRLMQEVQCRVQAQFGVTLEPEVRLIGHFEA